MGPFYLSHLVLRLGHGSAGLFVSLRVVAGGPDGECDVFKPLLSFFWTYSVKPFIGYPLTSDTKKYPDWGTYIWVDRNNDQILQEDEITPAGASPSGVVLASHTPPMASFVTPHLAREGLPGDDSATE